MLSVPTPVRRYLAKERLSEQRACYLKIDDRDHLLDFGGPIGRCGLNQLSVNAPVLEQCHFLEGMTGKGGAPMSISYVQLVPDRYASIHIFWEDSFCWVLLLESTVAGTLYQRSCQSVAESLWRGEQSGFDPISRQDSADTFLLSVMQSLDAAMFIRQPSTGLRLQGMDPVWLGAALSDWDGSPNYWPTPHSYLAAFMPDIAQFWHDGVSGRFDCGFWQSANDKDMSYFTATALNSGPEQALLVFRVSAKQADPHACLSTARRREVVAASRIECYEKSIAELNDKILSLGRLAVSDPLTGVSNRHGFVQQAQQMLDRARFDQCGLVLLMIDMDNLKPINDTLGHHAGDTALQKTAKILMEAAPRDSLVARMGGDEFVVLAPCENDDSRRELLAVLYQKTERHNVGSNVDFPLAFSVGMASFDPMSPCTLEALTKEADGQMYRAKKSNKQSRLKARVG